MVNKKGDFIHTKPVFVIDLLRNRVHIGFQGRGFTPRTSWTGLVPLMGRVTGVLNSRDGASWRPSSLTSSKRLVKESDELCLNLRCAQWSRLPL